MNPDENAESGKSKADSFQSQTPAMKAWKKKYIADEKSDDKPSVSSTTRTKKDEP